LKLKVSLHPYNATPFTNHATGPPFEAAQPTVYESFNVNDEECIHHHNNLERLPVELSIAGFRLKLTVFTVAAGHTGPGGQ